MLCEPLRSCVIEMNAHSSYVNQLSDSSCLLQVQQRDRRAPRSRPEINSQRKILRVRSVKCVKWKHAK